MNKRKISFKEYPIQFLFELKLLLANKQIGLIILGISIISRIIQLIFFYNIRSDASYQIIATDNFIHGYGISESWVDPKNLSSIIYQPLTKWPPGFSLLITPLYLLFNENYIISGLVLDTLMAISLLLTCRAILRLLNVEKHWVNVFTLVNGFFIYPFYAISSSDDIAVSFMMLAVNFSLRLIAYKGKFVINALLLLLFLLISAFTKYLYVPVVFIVPLSLVFYGHVKVNILIKKFGLYLFVILLSFLGLFFVYQFQLKGTAGYISSTGRGLFPEHLQQLYPFITSAFISPELLSILLPSQFSAGQLPYEFLQIFTFLLMGAFLVYVIRFVIWEKGLNVYFNRKGFFYSIVLVLSAAVVAVLIGLSLLVSPEINFGSNYWTYVTEARYYGLVVILLQISFFVFLQHDFKKRKSLFKASSILLCVLLLIEVCRGFYFDINRIRFYGQEEYSWQYENRFQKYADTVVKKVKVLYPTAKVIIAGPSYYFNHRITLYSHVPTLYKPEILNDSLKVKTTQPVVAIIYVKSEQRSIDHRLSKNKILAGKFEDFYFYIQHVSPI